MMRRTIEIITWGTTALLLLTASAALTHYYFTFADNNITVIKNTHKNFYSPISQQWLRPQFPLQSDNITNTTEPLQLMVARTLLGRWRMQAIGPTAYTRIEDDLQRGWWGSGDWTAPVRSSLKQIDERWINARQRSMMRNSDPLEHKLEPIGDRGLRLVFNEEATTADIGSVIEIEFTSTRFPHYGHSPIAIWTTRNNPDVASTRIRPCIVKTTPARHNGRTIYRLTLDMSDEPEWLNPASKPQWITFNGSGKVMWEPISLRLYDSPLLPVPRPAIQFVP